MAVEAIMFRLDRWLNSDYDGVVFEHSTEPVGYALYRPTDPELKSPDGVYLRQFFIAPERRRLGLGTEAFREFASQVVGSRRLVLEVLETNPAGRSFWISLGLTPYSTTFESPPPTA